MQEREISGIGDLPKVLDPWAKRKALNPPTDAEVDKVVTSIYNKLEWKDMELEHNSPIKEGYMAAIDILVDDIQEISDVRYQALEITTTQGRAMSLLAMDYLKGIIPSRNILGLRPTKFPVKDRESFYQKIANKIK